MPNARSFKARGRLEGIAVTFITISRLLRTFIDLRLGRLVPLLLVLLIFAVILMLVSTAGPLSPFIYPLF